VTSPSAPPPAPSTPAAQGRPSRDERLRALAEQTFDLLVVGGGITGAGAARDAALRGLKVALVERRDWAAGTSSRSSKLVHGGLRYLQTYQLGLVRESTAERAVQLRVAPHLVQPCEFMMPVYREHKHGLWFINLGLWLYDALALFRVPRLHRKLEAARTLARQPGMRPDGLEGSVTYFDAATDDARLTLENVLDAEALGAVTLNHAPVTALLREQGRYVGARVRDELGGASVEIRAHLVVNTTGPWTDRLLALDDPPAAPLLRPTKGAHLVFTRERLPLELAVAMVHPRDGRAMFAIPWGSEVYVGTTDIDYQGSYDRPYCGVDDRDLILEAANHYFPQCHLQPADIRGTWCGLRPLIAPQEQMHASKVSREHVLLGGEDGLLTMTGGKLTTYRLMARELVSRAVKLLRARKLADRSARRCRTRTRPLPGARGLTGKTPLADLARELGQRYALALPLARHLADTYGSRAAAVAELAGGPDDLTPVCPRQPVLWVEVDHAARHEQVGTLEDFFGRRTQLLFRAPRQALEAAPQVAERLGRHLGWDAARREQQVRRFADEVRGTLACTQQT
jgi:glycerol-3-phosphate dehydrogenase